MHGVTHARDHEDEWPIRTKASLHNVDNGDSVTAVKREKMIWIEIFEWSATMITNFLLSILAANTQNR
jgi:hypothetical protein